MPGICVSSHIPGIAFDEIRTEYVDYKTGRKKYEKETARKEKKNEHEKSLITVTSRSDYRRGLDW
jgi:uncharacterized lipoprotein YddW (UPF0748 family)